MPDTNEHTHPYQVAPEFLASHIEEMVDATFRDLISDFLILPKGPTFLEYADFRDAFEVLKRHTTDFSKLDEESAHSALVENSRVFCVLRAILGLSAPEWAELALELGVEVGQNDARSLDRNCRVNPEYVAGLSKRFRAKVVREGIDPAPPVTLSSLRALIQIGVKYINLGSPSVAPGQIHRLSKFDTQQGLESVRYAAHENMPYSMALYERYLGRPFASHRDAVSELIGEVMENAIEERLRLRGVTYRKTKRAERIPEFGQAPDFCIPDEIAPALIIEAKITSDDGTARDKATRILRLATMRDEHVATGKKRPYEVVACIDGRGFRQRREDMRQILLALEGKVFTTATLDDLFEFTRLREFVTK